MTRRAHTMRDTSGRLVSTHGDSFSSEYTAWRGMVCRCHSPSAGNWSQYGGRGIKVCERWRSSYENFLADMGRKPSPAHSIDRVDVNGDYTPENCRWATLLEQSRNWCTNKRLTILGETLTVGEWAARVGVNHQTIHERLRRGWAPERAVFGPIDFTRRRNA